MTITSTRGPIPGLRPARRPLRDVLALVEVLEFGDLAAGGRDVTRFTRLGRITVVAHIAVIVVLLVWSVIDVGLRDAAAMLVLMGAAALAPRFGWPGAFASGLALFTMYMVLT